jgi:hypothetical protein
MLRNFIFGFLFIFLGITLARGDDTPPIIEAGIYEAAEDPDGPGPYEYTCPEVVDVKASSYLKESGVSTYVVSNLFDQKRTSAWVEGKSGLGIGEFIEFKLKMINTRDIGSFWGDFMVINGYSKGKSLWEKNARIKVLRCYHNNVPIADITLLDTDRFQLFALPEGTPFKIGDQMRFEILSVYKGSKWEDTAMSEFAPLCFP